MSEETNPSIGFLLAFLGGAAMGAAAVALFTPRTGPGFRHDLRAFGRRARRKAGAMANEACGAFDDMRERTVLAAADLKHGFAEAVNDLRADRSPAPRPPA